MAHNWQQGDWPEFRYVINREAEDRLKYFKEETARVSTLMKSLPQNVKEELLKEVVLAGAAATPAAGDETATSPYGMFLQQPWSTSPSQPTGHHAGEGMGKLITAMQDTFTRPLTMSMVFKWHRMLMGEEICAGVWRTQPMLVTSGPRLKQTVHFEAPPPALVAGEMKRLFQWFNETAPGGRKEMKNAPVRSALAHLHFESVHPFEDGNGRIGRVIAEKTLAQAAGRPVLLNLAQAISSDKKNIITPWRPRSAVTRSRPGLIILYNCVTMPSLP